MSTTPVKVRIAPSPTGDPHVGTAYIGLFNYVYAKKHGGSFVLRIEDTDQARSSKEAEQAIYDALKWVGLSWDEGPDIGGPNGPYRQSERLEIYRKHLDQLIENGHAYYCTCTPERLQKLREEQKAAKEQLGYDGHCRGRSAKEVKAEIDAGAPYVVRLKVPSDGVTTVHDELRGPVEFENAGIDDQVLLKGDGFPTYHLANVVDDHLMGITHVIRGEEWMTSCPKHVLLYQGFGWKQPAFAHLPLLRNKGGSKISKRNNPVSLMWYPRVGILPQALLNFLGMMGWTMPNGEEVFTVEDMIKEYSFERVHLGGPVFDLEKLIWLNGKHIRERLDDDQIVDLIQQTLVPRDYLKQMVPLVKERVDKLGDFFPYAAFFMGGTLEWDPAELIPKKGDAKTTTKILKEVAEAVDEQFSWSVATIEEMLRVYCEKSERKPRDVFMPVRVAVTGKKATPPLFETMEVLGRELCRNRLRQAAEALKGYKPPQPKQNKK